MYQFKSGIKEGVIVTKGIDVSVHQGDIEWKKVKSDSVEFAILRAGYGKEFSQKSHFSNPTLRRKFLRDMQYGLPTQV